MTSDQPHQPTSQDADRSKEPSPIGVAEDLEEEAEKQGASTEPDATPEGERQMDHETRPE